MQLTNDAAIVALISRAKLLIFDFDGTIADTAALHARAFALALKSYGVEVDYPSIAGMKTADAVRTSLARIGMEISEGELALVVTEKQAHVRTLISERLDPIPGVDRFLHWARPRYQMALCSSGSNGTVGIALAKLDYREMFSVCVVAEDVVAAKPDPEGFLRVLELTGHSAADALVFEDSRLGIDAAEAAGIACICVDPSVKSVVVSDWGRILDSVDKLK